jgi:DNA-binding NarL/FixJ family response regulator
MTPTWLKPSNQKSDWILVVDDDEIIRIYLECLLVENGYRVSVASDFDEAKAAISRQEYALIISDLVFLEKTYSGMDIVKHARFVCPKCKAIILTSYPSTHTAIASLRMQVVDYLTKPASQEDILSAVRQALCGNGNHMGFSSHENDRIALSAREKDVLLHLFQGYAFSEIAILMGCSLSTVQTYSRRIYKKLGVHSRSEATHEALRQGLISQEHCCPVKH